MKIQYFIIDEADIDDLVAIMDGYGVEYSFSYESDGVHVLAACDAWMVNDILFAIAALRSVNSIALDNHYYEASSVL